jgi:hypothetical protein
MASAGETATLSIFWEGTANTLRPTTTLVGVFFEQCLADDVTSGFKQGGALKEMKMGFDGCGVVAGLAGTIWAIGLLGQCDIVVARVQDILATTGLSALNINVLGLSRGAVGALYLSQKLSSLPLAVQAKISLRLCLFDPVPGNLIHSARYADLLGISTANAVMDVSHCSCIKRCLAIYPHEPLPDLAFHAPVLPTYPPTCELEEDSTLGCHQGAFYPPAVVGRDRSVYRASLVSYHRVHAFLSQCGTRLPPSVWASAHWWKGAPPRIDGNLEDTCVQILNDELQQDRPSTRMAHKARFPGMVVRHSCGKFFNRHHMALVDAGDQLQRTTATRQDTLGGTPSLRQSDLMVVVKRHEDNEAARPLLECIVS